ncbi:MAG TPA: reverse transcriptase family protein, partial [Planctomycetaceae bacterium]|nr:reverse transcriptase family protein [Planctomycetaceae bacterium]
LEILRFLRWYLFGEGRRLRRELAASKPPVQPRLKPRRRIKLKRRFRWTEFNRPPKRPKPPKTKTAPYLFSTYAPDRRHFLDLSHDGDHSVLANYQLPVFHTPQELANWLGIRVGALAWLVHRGTSDRRPHDERRSHYVYRWVKKRSISLEAGAPNSRPVPTQWRLIEAPKRTLKAAQRKILTEILEKIPAHQAAHGFLRGRSIVTNARPHVGQAVVIKLDLQNFYANVTYSRVVAIFRSLGYCREAAIWLGRLTTSAVSWSLAVPDGDEGTKTLYVRRHLPQGAPTSPALANLSAFGLDVRLSGLLKKFGGNYTRYADDLTLSGSDDFRYALRCVIPLTEQIVRSERFRLNHRKRKVIRRGHRQLVTGVVVNDKLNVRRDEFDTLKAILTNCVKHGPSAQNREAHADFTANLRGRIAFVRQLNRNRGDKLLRLFERIDWRR